MSVPPSPRRSRAPTFEPRFTLVLVYMAGFFMLYCLLLILPALVEVQATPLASPETEEQQRAVAEAAAREAMRGKLLPAFVLALLTSALGGYYRVLPGLRPRS